MEADVPGTPHFTNEEIEKFCKILKTLPTYRTSDDSIDFAIDGPSFFTNVMKWNRTLKQFDAYSKHINAVYGGRMSLTYFRNFFRTQHNKHALFRVYVDDFDANKDGFISKEEFETSFGTLRVHDPTVPIPLLSFAQVLKQADTNKDGKLSTDELVEWLKKVTIPKVNNSELTRTKTSDSERKRKAPSAKPEEPITVQVSTKRTRK